MTPLQFADALRAYCMASGSSVTSWGRTPNHNKTVGGVTDSAHLLWIAADVVYDMPGDVPWHDALAARVGLMIVHEGDHDHVQPVRG